MTNFLSEAIARLSKAVAEPNGSTVTITKADACVIGSALIAAHTQAGPVG